MQTNLEQRIRAKAKVWGARIRIIAYANLGKYKKLVGIQSRVEERNGKIGIITTAFPTTISTYGDVKDVARAYEYGSGIHSSGARGIKRKYPIVPRRKKALAFHWEIANANPDHFTFGKDGRVLLSKVMHPGVMAANGGKGYLRPAITEVRKQVRKELSKETRDAILGTFRKSFHKR